MQRLHVTGTGLAPGDKRTHDRYGGPGSAVCDWYTFMFDESKNVKSPVGRLVAARDNGMYVCMILGIVDRHLYETRLTDTIYV